MNSYITKIKDLSLKKKLYFLILLTAFIMSTVALFSVEYINRANQELLNRSVASSLQYLSLFMEKELDSYVDITASILSDELVQKTLSDIKDSGSDDSGMVYLKYNSTLSSVIDNYYYEDQSKNLLYIMLKNKYFTNSTYNRRSSRVSEEIKKEMTDSAVWRNGRPVWISQYSDEYGLFLCRSVRRMRDLKLDQIGVITLAVDIRKMIEETIRELSISEGLLYALYNDENEVFLCSEGVDRGEIGDAVKRLSQEYGVAKIGTGDYFISRGKMGDYGWGYLFFVPYQNIAQKLEWARTVCMIVIISSCLAVIAIVNGWVLTITRHFDLLVTKMIAFGKDDSRIPDVGYDYSAGKDEIAKLHNQFDLMADKVMHLINENYKNEILKKDMELRALQNQMNPHFLYNTLHAVHWKAKAAGETQISEMVQALGSLLRSSLSSKEERHTIGTELEIVDSYMTIQQIRFSEKLDFYKRVEEGLLDTQIPLLTIQPIVENAVNYGLEESIEGCEIELEIREEDADVWIRVTNNGTQFESGFIDKLNAGEILPHGFGIGMLNIHKRIQMTYGSGYGLSVYNADEEHAVAVIKIPGEKKTDA